MEISMETSRRHLWEGMWKNKNVYGTFPQTFLFSSIPCHKCQWKRSIDICGRECGKIKMSIEIFHRYLLQGM
jgi:hypothetical protein